MTKLVPPMKMCHHGFRAFFCLFEAQLNVPSASAQAAETRNERHSVVSGLTGHQVPLGNHHVCSSAQLCSKTSTNSGAREDEADVCWGCGNKGGG